MIRTVFILGLIVMSGCAPEVSESVKEYVETVKQKKNPYKGDLPDFGKEKVFKYTAGNYRDPFTAFSIRTSDKSQTIGPELNRRREELESYPLDTLTMVGTIEENGEFFALLKDSSGIVHVGAVGGYIGQNSGKIEKISPIEMSIKQWVSDNKGGWREFVVKMYIQKSGGSSQDSEGKT